MGNKDNINLELALDQMGGEIIGPKLNKLSVDTKSANHLQEFANMYSIFIPDEEALEIVQKIGDDLTQYSLSEMNNLIDDYANLRIDEWFKNNESEEYPED